MLRRRVRYRSVLVSALVLVACGAILAMHGFAAGPAGLSSMTERHVPTMPVDAAGDPGASLMAEGPGSMPLHELLECVWLVVSGLIVAFAMSATCRRPSLDALREPQQRLRTSVQRAPPVAVRLSLVGVARC